MWTKEKIWKCSEIKSGVKAVLIDELNEEHITRVVVVNKPHDLILAYHNCLNGGNSGVYNFYRSVLKPENIRFFNFEGVEIKPPKVKKEVKFYQYVTKCGALSKRFYSDGFKWYWRGQLVENTKPDDYFDGWLRTNCYVKLEVEV